MARAKWLRVSIYVVSGLAALTLVIGLLHTPLGRPLLAKLGVGCPVQATPEETERARLESARATRGSEASPAQPALGFVLDKMTAKDALAWAERNHVDCSEQRAGSLLNCKDVPESALGGRGARTLDELQLVFSPTTQRLVNIATTQYGLAARDAASQMSTVTANLEQELGKPTREAGQRTGSYLDAAPYRTALVRYRFSDYQADVTATNIPGKGTMLREHYMSARD
ncbi:MAG: hypothetical protein ABW061_26330 [Polyangiaceae bacterium]